MDDCMTIDYRLLLRKYMQEVLACEGVTFVGSSPNGEPRYTAAEREALLRVETDAVAAHTGDTGG